MRVKLFALLIALLIPFSATAKENNGGASAASVRELMAVTQTKRILDNAMAQIDGWMNSTMKQATAGKKLTPEQDKVVADMQAKMVALYKKDMTWDTLQPMFVDIYQKSFTQEEIDGMLTFYRSKAGQAMITKMPIVMQSSMQIMQKKLVALMPKIQVVTREAVLKMKALEKPVEEKDSNDSKKSK